MPLPEPGGHLIALATSAGEACILTGWTGRRLHHRRDDVRKSAVLPLDIG